MQEKLGSALSVAVAALNNMACGRYDESRDRYTLFNDTIAVIREHVGLDVRLTTMKVTCAWCEKSLGDVEGDGATGESHGLCISCKDRLLAEENGQ